VDRSLGLFVLIGALFFAGGALLARSSSPAIEQPFPFNHKVHAEGDVDCSDCHFRCEKNRDEDGDLDCAKCEESEFIFCEEHVVCPDHTLPGLPGLSVCAGCHEGDDADSPQKETLIGHLESGEPIRWKRVTSLSTSNIYFSHRTHAVLKKIPCSECHGDIEKMTEPPRRPPLEMGMEWCLDCHHEEGASEGCVACHR
jgi:hypothetical protein